MGYRSDVFLGLRKQDVPFFMEQLKYALSKSKKPDLFKEEIASTTLEDTLGARVYMEDSKNIIYCMAHVKWYDSCYDVQAFNETTKKFLETGRPYSVVSIGEDGADSSESNADDTLESLGFEMYAETSLVTDGIGDEPKSYHHKCKAVVDGEICGFEFSSTVSHSVCPCCGVEDRMTVTKSK